VGEPVIAAVPEAQPTIALLVTLTLVLPAVVADEDAVPEAERILND
jgi:hypothetical protein